VPGVLDFNSFIALVLLVLDLFVRDPEVKGRSYI